MIVTSSGSYVEGDDVCRVNEYSTRGCVDIMPCSARAYRGKAREGTTRNDASAESIRKKGLIEWTSWRQAQETMQMLALQ